ncbi:MAG: hypothetical protein Q4G59_09730, partial [Planctomycetia bacterium]|nr:hypothetical protein [Planctomycetia bacterium]
MNNSISRLIWVMFGVAFGIAVTGVVFFCFAPAMQSASWFSSAQNSNNMTVEHTVSRPVSPPKHDSNQVQNSETNKEAEGFATSGTGSAKSPQTADSAKPQAAPASHISSPSHANTEKKPEGTANSSATSNSDYQRLLAEANQLLDVIVKLDFTTSSLPEYKPLVKQLADAAGTAAELKTALEVEKKFQAAVKQVGEKRETWFLAKLGELRSALNELTGSP